MSDRERPRYQVVSGRRKAQDADVPGVFHVEDLRGVNATQLCSASSVSEGLSREKLFKSVEAITQMTLCPYGHIPEDSYASSGPPRRHDVRYRAHSASLRAVWDHLNLNFMGDDSQAFDGATNADLRAQLIGQLEAYLEAAVAWRPTGTLSYSRETLMTFQYLTRNQTSIAEPIRKFIRDYRAFYSLPSEWSMRVNLNEDCRIYRIPEESRGSTPSSLVRADVQQVSSVGVDHSVRVRFKNEEKKPVDMCSSDLLSALRAYARLEGSGHTAMAGVTQLQALVNGPNEAEASRREEQLDRRMEMRNALLSLFDSNKSISDYDFVRAVLHFQQDRAGDRVVRHAEVEELEYFIRAVEHLFSGENLDAYTNGRTREFKMAVLLFRQLMKEIEAEKQSALAVPEQKGAVARFATWFKGLFS